MNNFFCECKDSGEPPCAGLVQLRADLAAAQEARQAAEDQLELAAAERSSAAEAATILFDYLGWKSGGLGSAAIETVQRAQRAEALAESYRKALDNIEIGLRKAGASLPAPEITGTIEGSMNTGLCIALCLVVTEREALK